MQRDHADAEIEAARLSGCEREGGQSVRLAGVVHPERRVAERLGLARTCADDLGSGGREQCESISHRAFLLKDFVYDTRTVLADVVTEAVLVRQLVEVRLQRGVQRLLGGADRIIELVGTAGADDR